MRIERVGNERFRFLKAIVAQWIAGRRQLASRIRAPTESDSDRKSVV